MEMNSKKKPFVRSLAVGALVFGVVIAAWNSVISAQPASSSSIKDRLSVSLPEVMVETGNIAHLISIRVRPKPPARLGVDFPDILAQPENPPISLPPRPLPSEVDPDPELATLMGGISRFFGDEKVFESGLAYLKKSAPVEALSYFDFIMKTAEDPRLKVAGLFWSAEALLRLGRVGETRTQRERLMQLPLQRGGRYAAAARYAVAEEKCKARDIDACFRILDEGRWQAGNFAFGEANFLRGWAFHVAGSQEKALEAFAAAAGEEKGLARRALVAVGYIRHQRGEFALAEIAFSQAEAVGEPRDAEDTALVGEAVHGIGWARLRLGRLDAAGRTFSFFLRQYSDHPLRVSAQVGALAVEMERASADSQKRSRVEKAFREFSGENSKHDQRGALQLQLAWTLFRQRDFEASAKHAASVSDAYPLGRVYRLGRVVEGLSLYHLGKVKEAYGVLRLGSDRPPRDVNRRGERSIARSAALATAFAAFQLKDFASAKTVLESWAFSERSGQAGGKQKIDPEAALWYGEAAFEGGDIEKAGLAFSSVPEEAREWYQARAGLAWIHYRKREWKRAVEAFDKVFSISPHGPLAAEALARAGEARFNEGNYQGALQAFDRIEREFTGTDVAREALFQKGKLLFRRDMFKGAQDTLSLYLDRYPKSPAAPEALFLMALVPFRRGEFDISRGRLFEFIDRHPNSPWLVEAFLRVGDTYYNEKKYSLANRTYRLMINRFKENPRTREAAYGLILTRLQLREYERFLKDARSYIEKYPGDDLAITLNYQIGELHFTQNRLDEALRAYREVERRHAGSDLAAHALLRIASIYRRRNKVDAAITAYELLLRRHPDSPLSANALFGAGETLARVGRCAEARVRLENYIEEYPSLGYAPLARFEAGRCAVKLGDGDAAIGHLGAVAFEDNGGLGTLRGDAALLLAALHFRRKEKMQAERALGVAARSEDPNVAVEALFSLAEIRASRGDARAGSNFLKLTYRFPDQKIWVTRALGRAGDLYEKVGDRTTAFRIFQKMIRIAPSAELREKAEAALKRLRPASTSNR